MGSVITIILSYHQLKEHRNTQKLFFNEDKELKESMPLMLSSCKDKKDG